MRSYKIKSRGLRFLMLLAFVMASFAVAVAENGNDDMEKAVDETVKEVQREKEVLTTLEQRMQKRISVDFRNTPIDDVLRMMTEQANVDIIKSPKVIGNVTATLTDVPLKEALDNILAAHGYSYIIGKNMIRVASIDEITETAEILVSRIYRITYADVTEVADALNKFKSRQGIVSFNKGTSHIIITDTESNVRAIDTFIEEIDRITPQVLVEVRIYDIPSQDTLGLGVEWSAGRNTTIDSALGSNPTAGREDPFIRGLFSNATDKTGSSSSGLLRVGWFNAAIDVDAILKAQQEITCAKLLANPRILVLDNETATFEIIREIPYTEESDTSAGGTLTSTKFKEVGVTLEVTPHITRDGMLRLHIIPEFGVEVGTRGAGAPPTVDTRRIDTIALVQDGQTVVLGGLRKKDVSL